MRFSMTMQNGSQAGPRISRAGDVFLVVAAMLCMIGPAQPRVGPMAGERVLSVKLQCKVARHLGMFPHETGKYIHPKAIG